MKRKKERSKQGQTNKAKQHVHVLSSLGSRPSPLTCNTENGEDESAHSSHDVYIGDTYMYIHCQNVGYV